MSESKHYRHEVTFNSGRHAKLNKISDNWDLFNKQGAYLGSAESIREVEKLNKETE
jgi:hypothetical protein